MIARRNRQRCSHSIGSRWHNPVALLVLLTVATAALLPDRCAAGVVTGTTGSASGTTYACEAALRNVTAAPAAAQAGDRVVVSGAAVTTCQQLRRGQPISNKGAVGKQPAFSLSVTCRESGSGVAATVSLKVEAAAASAASAAPQSFSVTLPPAAARNLGTRRVSCTIAASQVGGPAGTSISALAASATFVVSGQRTCNPGWFVNSAQRCSKCLSSASPFKTTRGNEACYMSDTLFPTSRTCTELVLPAFIRSSNPKRTVGCIYSSKPRVDVLLPIKSSVAPFLNAGSYAKYSLRLAGIKPRQHSDGRVIAVRRYIGGNQRLLITFQDTHGVLRKRQGRTVQLTGVLRRGKPLLPMCFRADLSVC